MTAAIAEMLLQSQDDELSFLPARPDSWKDGEVRGLRARGGFEVGLRWKAGALEEATVASALGRLCRIRSALPLTVSSSGKTIRSRRPEASVLEFETASGSVYVLTVRR
jgi:alpha-L-fucosidase 2